MRIDQKLGVPLNAMMFCMVIEILWGLLYFGSSAAYNAFSGVGVISLNTAYVAPVAMSLFTGRKRIKTGRFYLGHLGTFCNVAAIGNCISWIEWAEFANFEAWCLLAIPLFCMPSTIPVTASTVNYAPVVFVATGIVSGIWYWVWGYENYTGPPTHED